MKICFIVLAHHQPRIFHELIRNITWPNSDVVVHIDKRSDINQFPISGFANVRCMQNRRRVHWSGWSLTKTICAALEYALQVSDADYFLYMSGTDFPIQRADVITEFLKKHYPTNFLNYYPLVPGIWGIGLIDRYWLNDLKASLININPKDAAGRGEHWDEALQYRTYPNVSYMRRMLGNFSTKALRKLNDRFFIPRNTTWTNFYCGSAKWCLNRETVRFVVDYYHARESRNLRNYLRLCANSDEIFFQTSILNSKHKEQCLGFDEVEAKEIFENKRPPMPDEKRVNLTYVDWSEEREDPAILVESDFQRLKDSGNFFAMKFTDDKSFQLVKRIERELLGGGDAERC
jgi:hypothetical protein